MVSEDIEGWELFRTWRVASLVSPSLPFRDPARGPRIKAVQKYNHT